MDVILAAGGMTCIELGFLGVPQLILSLADNQVGTSEFLQSQGFARYLGSHRSVSDEQLLQYLVDALDEYEVLRDGAKGLKEFLSVGGEQAQVLKGFYERYLKDPYTEAEIEDEYTYEKNSSRT